MRRRQKIDYRAMNKISLDVSSHSSDETGAEDPEQVERIKAAIRQLPESQQDVVRLRIYEDLKFIEIAEHLDVPLGTVLTRMRTAVKKLSRVLRDEF